MLLRLERNLRRGWVITQMRLDSACFASIAIDCPLEATCRDLLLLHSPLTYMYKSELSDSQT